MVRREEADDVLVLVLVLPTAALEWVVVYGVVAGRAVCGSHYMPRWNLASTRRDQTLPRDPDAMI